jgi:hypothetical protein
VFCCTIALCVGSFGLGLLEFPPTIIPQICSQVFFRPRAFAITSHVFFSCLTSTGRCSNDKKKFKGSPVYLPAYLYLSMSYVFTEAFIALWICILHLAVGHLLRRRSAWASLLHYYTDVTLFAAMTETFLDFRTAVPSSFLPFLLFVPWPTPMGREMGLVSPLCFLNAYPPAQFPFCYSLLPAIGRSMTCNIVTR